MTEPQSDIEKAQEVQKPENKTKKFWGLVWVIGIAATIISGFFIYHGDYKEVNNIELITLFIVVSILSSAFLIAFIWLFTGQMKNTSMNQMVRFCYIFAIFFLILPVALAMISATKKIQTSLSNSPIGMVKGCALRGIPTDIPLEIRCFSENQWLFHIGGVVIATAIQPDDADLTNTNPTNTNVKSKAEAQKDKILANAIQKEVIETNAIQENVILGGVVVPVHLIIFAIFGGVISLMRNVPKIQEDYWINRSAHLNDSNPISTPNAIYSTANSEQESEHEYKVRADLIFQIMQVVSAPLIAMTAYYLFAPSSPIISVLLGFASGFTSESILQHIQAAIMKLQPTKNDKKEGKKKP